MLVVLAMSAHMMYLVSSLLARYVFLRIAVLTPMNYYEHPDDMRSMKGRAEILCGERPHSVFVVLSMLTLMMYPVACWVCPHNDSRAVTNELLSTTRIQTICNQ